MNNKVINCSEMIEKTFYNIEKSTLEKNNKFYSSWKKVVTKISKESDKEFGQKLYEHSSVIDIKNETLFVETDHPAWSQMMQFYTNFILKGLKIYVPEMKINSIVFRTAGNNAMINSSNYEEEFKKERKKINEEIKKENIKYEKEYSENKKKLPENLELIFETIKKSMLTKNNNN